MWGPRRRTKVAERIFEERDDGGEMHKFDEIHEYKHLKSEVKSYNFKKSRQLKKTSLAFVPFRSH